MESLTDKGKGPVSASQIEHLTDRLNGSHSGKNPQKSSS